MAAEVDGELAATLHYATDLFEAGTIARMLQHFSTILESIVRDPRQPIDALTLLLPTEEQLVLNQWNDPPVELPEHGVWFRLFEEHAAQTPEAPAVSIALDGPADGTSYAELNRGANRLARQLAELGVGPGALIAVCLERTTLMLTALLAIHKAGGAYLPLDPVFPAERLAFMLEDSGAELIVSQASLKAILPASSAPVLLLDQDTETPEESDSMAPPVGVSSGDLAYLIYTSGSTGRPKGVRVSHGALLNFLVSMRQQPGFSPDDRLLAVTTLSFDIAALELFLPLICGGHVVIASRESAHDAEHLAQAIEQHGISVMQATPATWRLLLTAGWPGRRGLRVLVGGEALAGPLASQLLDRCDSVWNMYGPTETTIWSTLHRVGAEDAAAPIVPIGRPIANTQAYILDGRGQLLPPGVVGELYLGGRGVADGYHNRPELTAERFVANPFAPDHTGRLYRTGDLARWRARGVLEFLGRADQQVKLRGFRIELGEVEATLSSHPAISEAAVFIAGRDPDQQHLCAALVPAAGAAVPDTAALRAHLRQSLPDYMLPVQFIAMDTLPLTPNGKLDRRVLALRAEVNRPGSATRVAPRTPLEGEVLAMCAEVLGIQVATAIGIHDSFFELGGHSMLATRLVIRLRDNYNVKLPLRAIFEAPTVAGLAAAVEQYGQASTDRDHGANGARAGVAGSLFSHMSVGELNAEAVLDPFVGADGLIFDPSVPPRRVLLTGATGFVGAYLLRDLIHDTHAEVYCLVRAADASGALGRIQANLAGYQLLDEIDLDRIVPVTGDLAAENLGLAPDVFASLAREIDWIYHNGALVNFVYPYSAHRPANVLGTQAVLRLASQARLKPVHFVSTLSVFHTPEHPGDTVFRENDELEAIGAPYGGYAQSKWVSEKLVTRAGARGLPVAIYRPGSISGDSVRGAWNIDDFMCTLIKVCLTLEVAPELDVAADIVPVDYVSGAIVRLSQQPSSFGRVFHLSNPRPLRYAELVDWVRRRGYRLRLVAFQDWQAELLSLAAAYPGSLNNPFLPLIEDVSIDQVFMPRFDCANTLAGLGGTGFSCPPLDTRLLDLYMDYFQETGYIAPPGKLLASLPATI
jgi:amino acid adenylation domain-containing protein/thioester reductase-like protein